MVQILARGADSGKTPFHKMTRRPVKRDGASLPLLFGSALGAGFFYRDFRKFSSIRATWARVAGSLGASRLPVLPWRIPWDTAQRMASAA